MSCVRRGIVLRQMGRLFGDGTLTGLGDGQLLERYLTRRDDDAFEALVDLHGPMVLGLCRRMLRDPRDIEDAFQATFLVLVRKAPAIRDRNLLSNWLYGVAYRVARRARTRTLRRRDRETTVGTPEVASGPDPTDRTEFDAMLDQELSRLPEKYRAPLVLCYLRGRTHDQAAEELRCPVGTVRSRMARGRDLLRDRLTRRGFAPTAMAAILGGDPIAPARLLVATVPPTMAAATVRAAVEFASSPILKAGATSLALAQGVLTTMKLTQIKWVVLAAMATSLSAGSVVAVAYAASPRQEAAKPEGRKTITVPVSPEQDGLSGAPQTTEAHLKALEDKIDRLSSHLLGEGASARVDRNPRAQGGGPTSAPNYPNAGDAAADRPWGSRTADPIEELDAQLKLAIKEHRQAQKLAERQSISSQELDLYLFKAQAVAGKVVALDHDFRDEMERLILERRRKSAQAEKASALADVAGAVVARNTRLNERKPGMVASEDVTKADSELRAAQADIKINQVEIDEVDLRIRQLDRRRTRLKELAGLADQVRKESVPNARSVSVPPSARP
jgi:RNA polymerase sigma factor (sigma-70 family)